MSSTVLTLLIVAGFLVVFPLFWCGIVYLVSLFGWQQLANAYATQQPMPSDMQLTSGLINMARYNGTLQFKADDRGIWLKTMVLFSPGHKPLFIPWSAVRDYKNTDSWWFYHSKFTANGVTIRLRQDLKPWIERQTDFV